MGLPDPINVIKTQVANATGESIPGLNTAPIGSQVYTDVLKPGATTATNAAAQNSTPAPTTTNTTNTNSGVYTGGATDPTTAGNIAAYQDQINSINQLLSQANVNQTNGTNAINTGYNNSVAQLQGNNQNVLNGYNTQQGNTTSDYANALNTIDSNARTGYNSLEQLLGGTGSAGNVLAPFAVSNEANTQRGASSTAYAQNLQAIQDGIDAANQNYNNQKKTLDGQQQTQLQSLLSSIAQQKIGYQQQLGADQNQINIAKGGSYATPVANNNAISGLLAQQSQVPAAPTFSVSDYTAPTTNLAGYQSQASQIASGSNTPSSTDTSSTDPATALTALLKQTQATNAYNY